MPQFTGRHGRDEIIESNVTFAGGLSVGGDFTVDDLTASGTAKAIAGAFGAGGTSVKLTNAGGVTAVGALSGASGTVSGLLTVGTLTLGAANLGAAATAATYVAGTAPVIVANQAYAAMTIGGTAYKILLFK